MKAPSIRKRPATTPQQLRSYLGSLPPDARRHLQKLRSAIRAMVPDAAETISYGIPTFKLDGRPLIYAAAWKEHASLYPVTPGVRRALGDELARYHSSKGTLRFPLTKEIPIAVVKKVVKARVAELRGGASTSRAKAKRAAAPARKAASRGSADVDAYLAAVPADKRAALQALRRTIAAAAPGAEEGFSYGLPAFRLRGRPLVCYGASANHCSLYPMSPAVVRALATDLKDYALSKGTIRFEPDERLPPALVKKIVKARMSELEASK
jgi:uncharacterized protein YdhG (YjbR/CyaY superfamily)